MEFAKKGRVMGIHKSLRLLHKDIFIESTVQKGIGDIELLDVLVKLNSESKDKLDSSWFNHWTECLSVVNAISLIKSFSHKTRFKSVDSAIRFSFNFINLFIADKVLVWWFWT